MQIICSQSSLWPIVSTTATISSRMERKPASLRHRIMPNSTWLICRMHRRNFQSRVRHQWRLIRSWTRKDTSRPLRSQAASGKYPQSSPNQTNRCSLPKKTLFWSSMTKISLSQTVKSSPDNTKWRTSQSGSAILVNRSQFWRTVLILRPITCPSMLKKWWRWTRISTRSSNSRKPVDSFSTNSPIECNSESVNRRKNWRKAGKAQLDTPWTAQLTSASPTGNLQQSCPFPTHPLTKVSPQAPLRTSSPPKVWPRSPNQTTMPLKACWSTSAATAPLLRVKSRHYPPKMPLVVLKFHQRSSLKKATKILRKSQPSAVASSQNWCARSPRCAKREDSEQIQTMDPRQLLPMTTSWHWSASSVRGREAVDCSSRHTWWCTRPSSSSRKSR